MHDCRMAYFYFDFRDYQKQKTDILIRSLLRQVVADEPHIPQPIVKLYDEFRNKGQSPTLKDLLLTLCQVLETSNKDTYLILDALDECPLWAADSNRAEMLEVVTQLMKGQSSNLHILATSRDEPDIRTALMRIPHREIPLEGTCTDRDIGLYVQRYLANPMERLSTFPDALKNEIHDALLLGAHGM